MKEKVIFIVGPTAVGKTAFAIKLARIVRGEIISADSMQAYRLMNILSQKPTPKEKRAIPHHLIDIININEEYSAARFVNLATPLIKRIIKRKRVPIIAGGSGLYVKALIDGLFSAPQKDTAFRRFLEEEADSMGAESLHDRLKIVDPESASKIHKNDLRRIIRALEIFHLTGTPISEHKKKTRGIGEHFEILIYGLILPRPTLYNRIEQRVDIMFDKGLLKEVRLMRKSRPGMTAAAALGYKEALGYMDKKYPLDQAKDLLKKNTRHLAKAQTSWFKADKRIRWIDLSKVSKEEAIQNMGTSFKIS